VETDRKISKPFEILKTQRSQLHAVPFPIKALGVIARKIRRNTKCPGQIGHSIPDFDGISQLPPGAAAK
jgi:hypothetical protein